MLYTLKIAFLKSLLLGMGPKVWPKRHLELCYNGHHTTRAKDNPLSRVWASQTSKRLNTDLITANWSFHTDLVEDRIVPSKEKRWSRDHYAGLGCVNIWFSPHTKGLRVHGQSWPRRFLWSLCNGSPSLAFIDFLRKGIRKLVGCSYFFMGICIDRKIWL